MFYNHVHVHKVAGLGFYLCDWSSDLCKSLCVTDPKQSGGLGHD
jgi:hypothetical protein